LEEFLLPRLVLATKNKGKVKEIRELLSEVPLEIVGLDSFSGLPEIIEDGKTFFANALIKAKAVAEYTKELTLADDSGLEVDYLDGGPGIYSARYGEPDWNDRERYEYLLVKLKGVSEHLRTARFRCVTVLCHPGLGKVESADGVVEGRIAAGPRGENGFGYDPVFYLPEYQCTMAELPEFQKNECSHRARAIKALIPKIREYIR
jgi:XTP/dITP diphosphohydrolase